MSAIAVDSSVLAKETLARDRLCRWLLGDAVQVRSGPHEGAVVGWCDAAGRASYVYPEITGYYLRWLAWHYACGGERGVLATRARAAERWLGRWLSSTGLPATRVYLHDEPADWRNGAFFFFDAAMALRGLASIERVGLLEVDRDIATALVMRLAALVESDGRFAACIAQGDETSLPTRWSTRRGPFLAKAAAGVLDASETFPSICAPVAEAARATLEAAAGAIAQQAHDEVHAQLYALEGALMRGQTRVRDSFDEIVAATRRTGRVPETMTAAGAHRLDVTAQLLRVSALIEKDGAADCALLRGLADSLCAHVTPDGEIPFDPTAPILQYNAWVAMFAEQALCVIGAERTHGVVSTLRALLV
ncbi:MAG: hypothetical protein ACM3X5_09925 [Bacillota bacterium]